MGLELQEEIDIVNGRHAILDQLEQEIVRVVEELARARGEANEVRTSVARLEEALGKRQGGEETERLMEENRDLRARMDQIGRKAREMLKKLDLIEER